MVQMTPKSYITLCVVGILYIIIGATAILSPHGHDFTPSANANSPKHTPFVSPLTGISEKLVLKNASGVEVSIPLEGMPVFKAKKQTITHNNTSMMFTTCDFSSVVAYTSFKNIGEKVVFEDYFGNRRTFLFSELKQPGNAYVCYADAELNPLDNEEFGYFCIYIFKGEKTELLTHIKYVIFE
jgi:hypothetical protein